jgi:Leishmanolysin
MRYFDKTGIGTLWTDKGLVGSGSSCPYLGAKATAEFQSISGCKVAAPTETDGGAGTACGHWDEDCMGSELMTGYVRNATVLQLSRITVGTLDDLGYTVDYSQADPFTKSNLNPNCTCRRRSQEVMQFSLPPSAPKSRQLSDAGLQMAWDYGMNILTERAKKLPLLSLIQEGSDAPDIVYVGHKLISVLMEEDGEVYGVMVTNP